MSQSISTEEFFRHGYGEPGVVVLDVRTPEEVADWSLPGVVNIPVEELAARLDDVPRGAALHVICLRGRRSLQAGAILDAAGIDATLIEGGMSAWGRTFSVAELELGAVRVVQLRRVGKGCLAYLVACEGECIVIDPSGDRQRLEAEIARRGWTPIAVLDTHLHADHVSLAPELASHYGARLVLADHGYDELLIAQGEPIRGDAPLEVGSQGRIEGRATPGHTSGSVSYLLNGAVLFSGDTLFIDSVGRPDLADRAEEFAAALHATLHEGLGDLDDAVLVLPGHVAADLVVPAGEFVGTTMGSLRSDLAALRLPREDFIAWASSQARSWPPNYVSIVTANRGLVALSAEEAAELELGPNRCAVGSAPSDVLGKRA